MLSADAIASADAAARAHFAYKPDVAGTNPWLDLSAEAEAGQAWSGQCADLTMTTLGVLHDHGQPIEALWRCAVDSSSCGHADHMIGATRDAAGQWWIVGDTFHAAYVARDCLHTPVQFQRMVDVTVWLPGKPWA